MLFPKFAAVFAAFAVAGTSAQKCKCPSNPCATDIVINGDFDDPLSGKPWTFARMETTTIKPRSSPQAALASIQNDQFKHSIEQPITLTQGKQYTLRYYWALVQGTLDPTANCQIVASVDTTNTDINSLLVAAPNKYNERAFTFTAAGTSDLQISVQCVEAPATININIDDVSLYPASCLIIED
ncbi:unnamed protein product [Clonostachys byssicola]|uniref:CBM-cenC domain-containing protein n=1 Tax=Clonostachys byssicola TaxID=160290 RepID=A0A9N9UU36_9HYPO|nr:unnamed protein product [Clonostachys byssicola]